MKIVLILCIACVAAGAPAGVFSQTPVEDPAMVGRGWFSHSEPRPTRNFKHADDFVLSEDAVVSGVRWWGLSEGRIHDDLTNFDAFTIEFFVTGPAGSDQPLPGELLASFTLSLDDTQPVATGRVNPANGAMEYRHEADFIAPVALEAGRSYFLAISARSVRPSRDGWMWQDAAGPGGHSASYSWAADEWTGFQDTDSAFELLAVPSPGGLMVLGLAVLSARRHRQVAPTRAR